MDPHLCIGIDVGCKAHRVGFAPPDGSILEEFDISHTDAGFQDFFRRVEERRQQLSLPVAVAMEGYNGYARPLDHLVQEKATGCSTLTTSSSHVSRKCFLMRQRSTHARSLSYAA